jgi:hypothetical protein
MRKRPEDIIYNIKKEITARALAKITPIRKFPEDFLDEKTKKDLLIPIKYPKFLKLGFLLRQGFAGQVKSVGRDHKLRREKIDPRKVNETIEMLKELEKESKAKYEDVLLPEGEVELNIGEKVEICLVKSGIAILKFPSFARAKYVLYSRKKGQWVYKIPKDETAVKKAVAEYEKYLKKIRDNLIKAFKARKANSDIADMLARDALKEMNLPYPYAI